jgi:hypothetical protein
MELLEVFEHRPKQPFSHFRVSLPVGVREGVLARRGGAPNGRQGAEVQPQGVARVVESQGVGQLGRDQTGCLA